MFLNGRQVIGKCPVEGCTSEKGYADECDLGHQYMPENLINPVSTLTGETPTMKPVTNWYFKLRDYEQLMKDWVEELKKRKDVRPVVWKTIDEFLKKPVIYIKREFEEKYLSLKDEMPAHNYLEEPKKPSFTIEFDTLSGCDDACRILTHNGIRYRTGKTLVPFRLTGNIEWGVPAPVMDGVEGLTVWVWPESLWAPISFTQTYLEQEGRSRDEWKDYWCSKESGRTTSISTGSQSLLCGWLCRNPRTRLPRLPRANCSSRQLWLTTTFFSSTRRLQARAQLSRLWLTTCSNTILPSSSECTGSVSVSVSAR